MKVWRIDGAGISASRAAMELEEAASCLAEGGLVAFPTETVYGLGANACDEGAVRGIFAAKGRPSDNPLIVHIADKSQLGQVIRNPQLIPKPAERLMDAFWPGPLTIVLPVSRYIAPSVHPGTDTVGVRMPNHPLALALIRMAGCPVAAPSANSSGRPSPTDPSAVISDLEGKIDGVLDGGLCDVGLESTVVAVTDEEGIVYRPGWITLDELTTASGVPFRLDAHLEGAKVAPKSPGMRYRHYAPDADVHVWWGHDKAAVEKAVCAAAETMQGANPSARIAFIAPHDYADLPLPAGVGSAAGSGGGSAGNGGEAANDGVGPAGNDGEAANDGDGPAGAARRLLRWSPSPFELYDEALSRELYRLLRGADESGATDVIVVGTPPEGRGLALMNRLQKASEGRLYQV